LSKLSVLQEFDGPLTGPNTSLRDVCGRAQIATIPINAHLCDFFFKNAKLAASLLVSPTFPLVGREIELMRAAPESGGATIPQCLEAL
jgi:hypothetical protein